MGEFGSAKGGPAQGPAGAGVQPVRVAVGPVVRRRTVAEMDPAALYWMIVGAIITAGVAMAVGAVMVLAVFGSLLTGVGS